MLKIHGLNTDDFGGRNEEAEKLKKIQRSIHEVIRRIDNQHQSVKTVGDVFATELIDLRVKLRELVNKIIRLDPGAQCMRYLESYWRKSCHEPVALLRNLGAGAKKGDLLLDSHLMAGMGHYHNLILYLTQEFGWKGGNLEFVSSNGVLSSNTYGFTPSVQRKNKVGEGCIDWVVDVVGRCYIWLGDLARYSIDLYPKNQELDERERRRVLACKYYTLATRIKPSVGLPYNQLASIVPAGPSQPIRQVFFYLKCMTSADKFEGGEANLNRLLEKNETELNNLSEQDEEKHTINNISFLHLVATLLGEKGEDEVTSACQHSLLAIHQVLGEEGGGGDWLCLCVANVILVSHMLNKNNKSVAAKSALCQAWLVAMLGQLSSLVVTSVGKKVWGPDWKEADALPIQPQAAEIEADKEPMPPSPTQENEVKKEVEAQAEDKRGRRKRLPHLLRRRRGPMQSNSESSSNSASEDELDFDDVEGSSGNSSQDESDFELTESEDDFSSDDSEFTDEDDLSQSPQNDNETEELNVELESILTAAKETGMLPTIWLCCLWLKTHPEVLADIGNSGENQFWPNICRLSTLLYVSGERKGVVSSDRVTRHLGAARIELPEESYVSSLDEFRSLLSDLASGETGNVEGLAATIGRLERLEGWRDWVCSRDDMPIMWDDVNHMAVLNNVKIEKKCMMKHMAELWLQEEVSQLEKEGKNGVGSDVGPVLVIVDTAALTTNLWSVKRAATCSGITVLVPHVVIKELDKAKKSVRSARDAIRWLERELSRGHEGLRAQEKGESTHLPHSPPHSQDGWARHKIAQYATYIVGHAETDPSATRSKVILLTGDPSILEGTDISICEALEQVGVEVESVEKFMERYVGIGDDKSFEAKTGRQSGDERWYKDRKEKSKLDRRPGRRSGPDEGRRTRSRPDDVRPDGGRRMLGAHHAIDRPRRMRSGREELQRQREEKLRRRQEARSEMG